MKKILDYTGSYKPKDGEHVVRANIRFFSIYDLTGYDAVVVDDKGVIPQIDIEIIEAQKPVKRSKK